MPWRPDGGLNRHGNRLQDESVWIRDERLAFAPARVVMRDDAGNCTCIGDDGKVTMPTGAPRRAQSAKFSLLTGRHGPRSRNLPARSCCGSASGTTSSVLEPRSACAVACCFARAGTVKVNRFLYFRRMRSVERSRAPKQLPPRQTCAHRPLCARALTYSRLSTTCSQMECT